MNLTGNTRKQVCLKDRFKIISAVSNKPIQVNIDFDIIFMRN